MRRTEANTAVREFLTEWRAHLEASLGAIITAGELADVHELERIVSLSKDPTNGGIPASSGPG